MAFHQPLHQRVARAEAESRHSVDLSPQILSGPDESQTWVLFSPATDAGTTTSYLSSVLDESQPTPGRSRISALGSLGTPARSDASSQAAANESPLPSTSYDALDESAAEEDAELDSLDSHLPDFRSVPSPYHENPASAGLDAPVLPGHDGLGSFRLDNQGMSLAAQDHLYAFEQFNPRRVKRRRESLELGQLELEGEQTQENERTRWIEEWRQEQSQLLLDEIRKETRRRRQSETSSHRFQPARPAVADDDVVTMSALDEAAQDVKFTANDWHEQDAPGAGAEGGIWSRITRRLIQDLMGIDDNLLSILFGESLPGEEDLSSTPKASTLHGPAPTSASAPDQESSHDSSWQLHVLERVARELGLLVHQVSTHHPGAFSTYKRVHQAPLPYAGLPVIPESVVDLAERVGSRGTANQAAMPQFQPTVAQPLAIPGVRASDPATSALQSALLDDLAPRADPADAFTQHEWEQDLDIKLVFRYLRSRFGPSSRASAAATAPFASGTAHLAASSTQDAAAKAARVRQHHPLVSHAHAHPARTRPAVAERRAFKATAAPTSPVAAVLRHHRSGSCASQSTRQSARRSSVSSRHSSRHYWDIGGSIGTGSMIASSGPMGSWGEV